MTGLFWNHREARLRAGWRVVVFVIASGVASTVLAGPARRFLRGLLPAVYANVVEVVVLVLLIGVFLWLAAKWLDRRSILDYGFHLSRAWWGDFGFGLALGVFLVCAVYALEFAIGWVKVTGTFVSAPGQPFVAAILADAIIIVGVAAWEEVVFRGYLIKNVAEGLNWKVIGAQAATLIAVLLPSLLFGWLHATEVNATTSSVVNTMIFGLLFGAAYVLTGELALPIGLHFAWDFVQAFGFGRSGEAAGLGSFVVLAEDDPAARLWTGWPFGMEGGLLGTTAFGVSFLLIAAWVRLRRGTVRVYSSLAQAPMQASAA